MKNILLLALVSAVPAIAQCGAYSNFIAFTAATNLSGAMNAKLNVQCGTVAPTALAGTAGIDAYINTTNGDYYVATVTGTPATWVKTLNAASNLSDIASVPTARTNLGLGTAATQASSAFAPATSGSVPLKGNGSGGTAAALASDIVGTFSGCSGTNYLGADGACHTLGGSTVVCAPASASGSAYTCTGSPVPTTLTGIAVFFIPDVVNVGGGVTLNIGGLGAKSIFDPNGQTPLASYLPAGEGIWLGYNGTNFYRLGGPVFDNNTVYKNQSASITPSTGGTVARLNGFLETTDSSGNKYYTVETVNCGTNSPAQVISAISTSGIPTCATPVSRDIHIVPFAGAPGGSAASGVSYASGQWTPMARVGSHNIGAALQATPSTGATLQFRVEIPSDWQSGNQPFIRIEYASGANTSGTVIWQVGSACTNTNGSVTDDPAFVTETAFSSQTMAVANRAWSQTGQFTAMTSGNNCVAGGGLIIEAILSGTASAAINAYQAVLTIPTTNATTQAN